MSLTIDGADKVLRMERYTDNMNDKEVASLLHDCEMLDDCYADAAAAEVPSTETEEDDWEDPVRDGWVDKNGRP